MVDGLLGFGFPGGWELIIVLVVALLLFGRRLPDIARSAGKSIVEFKKGLKDVSNQIENESKHIDELPPRKEEPDAVSTPRSETDTPAQKTEDHSTPIN